MVGFAEISGADTAWVLVSAALVLLMTLPGVALFYAGMVRRKNVLDTLAAVLGTACVVSVVWFAVGYSLAFTPGSAWIGGLDRLWFGGLDYQLLTQQVAINPIAPRIPEAAYAIFQMTFAIITAALIVGALVERMRFGALMLFMLLWSLFVYVPVAHWVWEPNGWLARMGALDFAGGAVVHVNAGAAGLACACYLGRRTGYGREPFQPYNLGWTMLGSSLLWIGWLGFNGGSALAADGRAALAMVVTHLAAACGGIGWALGEWLFHRRISLLGLCSGLVAGLVAVTPAAGYVSMASGAVIGLIAGLVCYWGATGFKRWLGADDALDVFGVHGLGGMVGALLTGVFASYTIAGVHGNVLAQAVAVVVVAVAVFSFVATCVLMWVTDRIIAVRVDVHDEQMGLDISQHREQVGH
ncbi:ammonium transporter [Comamonas kerstersii]|uniref:Ammonium transporter n=1 Tax=Comamonas kerstersii TaxID=225992 RepID=A0A6A1QZ52_9BURK|nr:ammonium transporter [Comamonas kerstersii]KAB0584320.1 ammonium transporter [Comamonas kerstersii]